MNWLDFFAGVLGAGVGVGAFGALFMQALNHRFSIEVEKLREERQRSQKQRDASVAVVEILAEWVKPLYSSTPPTNEDRWKLQTLYWRNILLLDKELISLLLPVLSASPHNIGTNELIARTRKHILGQETADVNGHDLNNWFPLRNQQTGLPSSTP